VHDDSGHGKKEDLGLDAQLVVRGGDRALRIWSDLVTRAKCEQARQELWGAASFNAFWQDRLSAGIDFDDDCDFLLLRSFYHDLVLAEQWDSVYRESEIDAILARACR